MSKPLNNPLSESRIFELEEVIQIAISKMERNPEKWAAPFNSYFNWKEGDFDYKGEGCYSDPIPSLDKGFWRHNSYDQDLTRKGEVETIAFNWGDTDGNWETYGEWTNQDAENDPIGFAIDSLDNHCVYNLLKMNLYSCYCARTGKDPLDNVMGQIKHFKGVYLVTIEQDKVNLSESKANAVWKSGDQKKKLKAEAERYCEGVGWGDLKTLTSENKVGRKGYTKEWTPVSVEADKIVLEVTIEVKSQKRTKRHVKEVNSRNLEKDVLELVADLDNPNFLNKGE